MLSLEEETGLTLTSSNISDQADRVRSSFQDLSLQPTYRFRADGSGGEVIEEAVMGLRSLIRKEIGVEASLDSGDRLLVSGTIDPRQFNQKAWCYDTPGLESSEQVPAIFFGIRVVNAPFSKLPLLSFLSLTDPQFPKW